MSFQPVVPLSGYGGWVFLNRTLDQQKDAFTQSGEAARNSAYFSETIGQIESAEELVSDRRLMTVALEAFGLGDDINAKAFVRKVLESPTGDREALAGKLSDKRYAAMAKALGFGDDTPLTTDRVADIVARYQDRSFEAALGEVECRPAGEQLERYHPQRPAVHSGGRDHAALPAKVRERDLRCRVRQR